MPIENGKLCVTPLPQKYDRAYRARARNSDAVYEVNLARLTCTCPQFLSQRSAFDRLDARRVCEHIYDKLYSTGAEHFLDRLLQLFIRYGRAMESYRVVTDSLGEFVMGQPFGPDSVRAIGVVAGQPVLATYEPTHDAWAPGETDLDAGLAQEILARMRTAFPEAFEG